jgi:hypothetical protein
LACWSWTKRTTSGRRTRRGARDVCRARRDQTGQRRAGVLGVKGSFIRTSTSRCSNSAHWADSGKSHDARASSASSSGRTSA